MDRVTLASPALSLSERANACPKAFYRFHALLLSLTAAALLVAFHFWPIDERLAAPFYDPATQTFPWRYAWTSKYFVHRYLKYTLLAVGVWVVVVALFIRWRPRRSGFLRSHGKRWSLVAWCFVVVPSAIGFLRRLSPMHCPWEIDTFGGYAPYFDLLTGAPAGIRPGHCFPAAFVGSASWMLAFSLLWYPERKPRAIAVGIAALMLSFALGWVQQMRGAHFLSHTLWSIWVSWAVVLLMHFCTDAWREVDAGEQCMGETAPLDAMQGLAPDFDL